MTAWLTVPQYMLWVMKPVRSSWTPKLMTPPAGNSSGKNNSPRITVREKKTTYKETCRWFFGTTARGVFFENTGKLLLQTLLFLEEITDLGE